MNLSDRQKKWAAGLTAGAAVIAGSVMTRRIVAARLFKMAAEEHFRAQRVARAAKAAGTRVANRRKAILQGAEDLAMTARGLMRNTVINYKPKGKGFAKALTRKIRYPGGDWTSMFRQGLPKPAGGRPKGTGKPLSGPRKQFGQA